jgi:hypothetical protein
LDTIGVQETCEPDDCWSMAMLSIGMFGTREEHRLMMKLLMITDIKYWTTIVIADLSL